MNSTNDFGDPFCVDDQCPHHRRKKILKAVALACLAVLVAFALWANRQHGIPLTHGALFIVLNAIICAVVVIGVPPIRRWFGMGQHESPPDEREHYISIRAQAWTFAVITNALPFLMLVSILFISERSLLAHLAISLFALTCYTLPYLRKRYLEKRM